MSRSLHQFVAGFTRGDAISNEAVVLRDLFRSWGYESRIFCESRRILPELRSEACDALEQGRDLGRDDIALLHFSIGSPVNDVFASLPCRKAILYHNITPPHYLELINHEMARNLARGREQLKALAGAADVTLADSRFNAGELAQAGYSDVRVLPLVLDLDALSNRVDRKTVREFSDGRMNILFVGRCVPNKKIEDLLAATLYLQEACGSRCRLIHVGSFAGTERYYHRLLAAAQELRLERCTFAGSVPQPCLNAFYQVADVFLSMSEHEGFGIPLMESMVHDIPVVAYAAAAVPETLDGAGILFREKRFDLVAELLARLHGDEALRSAVIAGQRERLERYRNRDLAAELKGHLAPLL